MKKKREEGAFSKKNLMALFIVIIMVFSIGGMIVNNIGKDSYDYAGYRFIARQNRWAIDYEGKELLFDFFPEEVENIDVSEEAVARLDDAIEIDSTYSPDSEFAQAIAKSQFDMDDVLGKISSSYIRVGMTSENEFDVPVIRCENATSSVPVLYFKKGNSTRAYMQGDCIIAEADSDIGVLRLKDRMLYGILGII